MSLSIRQNNTKEQLTIVCLLIYITASYKTAKEREEWHMRSLITTITIP